MNKKGFTLVELMAIIIVLGIISLIVIPTVNDTLTKQKEKLYEKQVDTIEKAAESWASANTDKLPEEDESICVELSELISSGFIQNGDIKDPRSNELMDGCVNITYGSSYNQYVYEYVDENLEP